MCIRDRSQTYSRTWEYASIFDKEPVTTAHSAAKGALFDEVHVVVIDEDGEWTGNRNEGLETFTGLAVANGAKYEDGTKAYYVDAINRRSKYIWWADHNSKGDAYASGTVTYSSAWGTVPAAGVVYNSHHSAGSLINTGSLSGGVDGSNATDGNKITAYRKFENAEETDIGPVSYTHLTLPTKA